MSGLPKDGRMDGGASCFNLQGEELKGAAGTAQQLKEFRATGILYTSEAEELKVAG